MIKYFTVFVIYIWLTFSYGKSGCLQNSIFQLLNGANKTKALPVNDGTTVVLGSHTVSTRGQCQTWCTLTNKCASFYVKQLGVNTLSCLLFEKIVFNPKKYEVQPDGEEVEYYGLCKLSEIEFY